MEKSTTTRTKTLVAGWFSFADMNATAGDFLAKDVACEWLQEAGRAFDVALPPGLGAGVDWRNACAADYDTVLFVCGPFRRNAITEAFVARFAGCRLIGLDLSLLDDWRPFTLVWERDSATVARPDISFLAPPRRVPVVGLALVHPQPQYGERARHREANAALRRLLRDREAAVVPIDTRLDASGSGMRTPGEVEAVLAAMDVVLTTRLHGTVLALKNGVPALAVDPIAGGAKIQKQAALLGWPCAFDVAALDAHRLAEAFEWCLSAAARERARACVEEARRRLDDLRGEFVRALSPRLPE